MNDLLLLGIVSLLIFIAPLINNITRIPVVVVEILLGAFAVNYGIIVESPVIAEIAHIGFLFLMFLAGMEVDLNGFLQMKSALLRKIALYFIALYALAALVLLAFDLPVIYIVALPVMSLGMIMVLLQEYGKSREWLNFCLQIAIIGELISIFMLVLLNGYYSFGIGVELYKSLGILVVFLCVMMCIFKVSSIVFWWFPSVRSLLIPDTSKSNQDIRYSIMLFFFMVVCVSLLNIESALGAFLSGLIIASFFRHKKELPHKLNDFGFGFLIPLFFVYIGTTLDFTLIFANASIITHAIFICAVMVGIRILATMAAFWSVFKNIQHILLFAFSNSIPLTFLVATAALGLKINAINIEQYYSFVLSAMLEAIVFMIIIKLIVYLPIFAAQRG